MTIENNKVVSLTYTLTVAGGQVVDQANEDRPFMYLHGSQNVLPSFEASLQGLMAGEVFDFTLTAANGYGEYDEEFVHQFDRKMFAEVPAEMLEIGRVLPMQDQFGNPMDGEIVEVTDESVMLDFNHPLAGEELHFVGKVMDIREATKEEITHGHIHGVGGVEH